MDESFLGGVSGAEGIGGKKGRKEVYNIRFGQIAFAPRPLFPLQHQLCILYMLPPTITPLTRSYVGPFFLVSLFNLAQRVSATAAIYIEGYLLFLLFFLNLCIFF